jgi:nucleoside-diphosphate-sugar epimerase
MRILIIGGTRFIGPRLVERLLAWGHEVAIFHRGCTCTNLPASVYQMRGDRRRLAQHAEELRRFAAEAVVDMIALTEEDARSLRAVFRGFARQVVVLSSGDVYRAYGVFARLEGVPLEPVPLTEDAPLRQAFFFSRSSASGPDDPMHDYEKILVEQTVLSDPDLPATVLRLPMVYGPGDYQHRLYPYLARMDAGRRVILMNECWARWRCPRGYVDDMAMAIALAAANDRAAGRVYNVAEPTAYTEVEWLGLIADVVGWLGQVVAVPRGRLPVPFNTDQHLIMDTSRIRQELDYHETVPTDEAFRRTSAWERANPPDRPVDYAEENAVMAELGL